MTAFLRGSGGRPHGVTLTIAIVLVYALLLPAYGPIVSPSYAEFLPNHTHVHLDGDPAHLHGYETPDGASSGFVALPSADDGSSSPGIIAAVALTALLALASAPVIMLLKARPSVPRGGIFTRTATPPPRAFALS